MYSVHWSALCTVYSGVHCVQCTVECTVYSVHWSALCTVYSGVHCVQCTLGQDVTLCHYFIISLANAGNVFSGSLRCRQVRIHPEKVSKTIIPILRHFSKY